jgi:hypothetical protein
MNKTKSLEKKWYRYKTKKFLFSFFITIMTSLLAFGTYFYFIKKDVQDGFFFDKNINKEQNISINALPSVEINTTVATPLLLEKVEEKIEEQPERKETLTLEPVIPLVDMEREEAKKVRVKSSKKQTHQGIKAKPSTYLTAKELYGVNKSRDTTKLKKINLTSSSKNYISTMKEKFLKNKNPRDALLLAKAFYNEGAYEASEKWSLEANKVNASLDESWMIFAKSKAKMGKKDEAVNILAMYYKKTKSSKIKVLLDKIKTGKL